MVKKLSVDIETAPLSGESRMFILDYPDLITTKAITEEGRKHLEELQKIMIDFMKEHPITLVNADGIELLK